VFQPLPGRDCGDCTVCCVELAIDDPELSKPDEVPCPHLDACGGCAIYASRPRTCATWFCGWRLLNLSDAMRPDRSRALLVPELCEEPGYQKGGLRLVSVGAGAEALLQDEVVDLAGRCVARGVPIFLSYGAGERCKRVLINRFAEPAVRAGDRAAFVRIVRDTLDQMAAQLAAEADATP
jgi:hypothetical protein